MSEKMNSSKDPLVRFFPDPGSENLLGLTTLPNDRRRGHRFKLRLSCRVFAPSAKLDELSGVTVDMSRSGVLVTFEDLAPPRRLPKIDDSVRIVIDLPHGPHISQRFLECMCRVVRLVKEDTGCPSVAFEIIRIRVRDENDNLPDLGAQDSRAPGSSYLQ